MKAQRILFVGDVVGRPGRSLVSRLLGRLVEELELDLVIVNAENAAGGLGLTPEAADELLAAGADVLTLGNHTWARKEILPVLEDCERVLRPFNYPPSVPGRGWCVVEDRRGRAVAVLNLLGRLFCPVHPDCPFRAADRALETIPATVRVRVVDFHAEATSEKCALAYYLRGRVTAVIGTHTHVPTADERVDDHGTGFLSDVGMTGPADSIIGVRPAVALERFLTQTPVRYEVGPGPAVMQSVLVETDPATGRCLALQRRSDSG